MNYPFLPLRMPTEKQGKLHSQNGTLPQLARDILHKRILRVAYFKHRETWMLVLASQPKPRLLGVVGMLKRWKKSDLWQSERDTAHQGFQLLLSLLNSRTCFLAQSPRWSSLERFKRHHHSFYHAHITCYRKLASELLLVQQFLAPS